MNITYEDYKKKYGGSLSEEEFERLLPRTLIALDSLTMGRFTKCREQYLEQKMFYCVCEAIDKMSVYAEKVASDESGAKLSETVGPHSVTYSAKSVSNSIEGSLGKILDFYLAGTCVMCRWL